MQQDTIRRDTVHVDTATAQAPKDSSSLLHGHGKAWTGGIGAALVLLVVAIYRAIRRRDANPEADRHF